MGSRVTCEATCAAVTGTTFDQLGEGQSASSEKTMDPRRNKESAEKVTPA